MFEGSILHKLLLMLVVIVGMLPLFFFSVVQFGITEASAESNPADIRVLSEDERYIENDAFGVGEKLTFVIKFGFISAGTATMEVSRLIEFNERPCYQVITRAKSNSFFSSFYKVDDRVESILDAAGLFSWRFDKSLREGSYKSDRVYAFDQLNHKVIYKDDTIPIEPFIHDALSPLYYIRTQPLTIGSSVFLSNFVDGKKYKLEVKVLKRETVTVEAGTFDCIVVEPLTQSVGVFKNKGKLKVWLTDDRLRMPVLMKSKVVVGSIAVELTDFKLGHLDEF